MTHIIEIFQLGLQLFIKLYFNQKFGQEVMGFQSGGSPNFENFENPNLGILGKMTFGCSHRG